MPTALDPVQTMLAFLLLLLVSALTNFDTKDRTSKRWRLQTVNLYAFTILVLGNAGVTDADRSSPLMLLLRYLGIVGILIAAGGLLILRWTSRRTPLHVA